MKKLFALIVLILQCFCPPPIKAVVRITPIPSLSQLPVSAIHRIFQDSEGYMWYGTVNGLCCDNGYQVKVFRSDINTPGLIGNNTIQCIAEASDGRIWFGTDCGAHILDKQSGKVTRLDPDRLGNQFVNHMYKTSDGYIWVSAGYKLQKYDHTGKLLKAYPLYDRFGSPTWINGFCENRQKEVLITLYHGDIYRYDKRQDSLVLYARLPADSRPTCIIQDNKYDYYWVGTDSDGLLLFNPLAPKDSVFTYSPLPVNSMGKPEGDILFVVQDNHEGNLWMTTHSDLIAMRYDAASRRLKQTDFRLPVASSRMLNEIYKDKEGALWVTSFDEKSFIIHFSEDTPEEYPLPALRKRVDFQPAIMALSDANERKIWISQERTGLGLYDLNKDNVSLYSDFGNLRHLPLHSIKLMAASRHKGNVWVVPENHDFVYEFGRENMQIQLRRIVRLNGRPPGIAFTRIYENDRDTLWIGTNRGLYLYDLKSGKSRVVCDTLGQVSAIEEDGDGRLWIGTISKGVYSLTGKGELKPHPTPKSVSCLTAASNGDIWIGTQEGGIYRLNPATEEQTDHTAFCGLKGDIINQLVADVYGHLWIDTNQKLIAYNPNNHAFSAFLTTDGSLLLHRFIPTAMCKGNDGKIYFGGIPGICAVSPSERLDKKSEEVNTLVTDIQIMDQPREISNESIILQPEETDLKIHFSSLDYLNAPKIRYAYRIKGLDKQWNYTEEGQNTAIYRHLPKGEYTFEVKATDRNGIWSDIITHLSIKRLPAFYETWWAILCYILTATGIIAAGVLRYIRNMNRRNEELYADSSELMKMRNYLKEDKPDSRLGVTVSDIEFAKLDEILLQKILKAVEDNLTEPEFDVSSLAEKVNMSRSSLTRKLKAITGLTPLEYIRQVKMQHACRMLEDPSKTISEIALMLGYFNRKYFTSCFKAEFGMTPSEYQKKLNGGKKSEQTGGANE